MKKQPVIRVLFVCMGNICRSPMAEAIFRDMVAKAGLSDKFEIDSAGTGGWHEGESAHPGTLDVLRRNGIQHRGTARQIAYEDLNYFDYVLTMDSDNLRFILRNAHGGKAERGLFLRYANEAGTVTETEVPDPYYDNTFDRAYNLIWRGCKALLDYLRQEHGV